MLWLVRGVSEHEHDAGHTQALQEAANKEKTLLLSVMISTTHALLHTNSSLPATACGSLPARLGFLRTLAKKIPRAGNFPKLSRGFEYHGVCTGPSLGFRTHCSSCLAHTPTAPEDLPPSCLPKTAEPSRFHGGQVSAG